MKRNAILRIVLYSIAILVLSGILLAGLGVGVYMIRDTGIQSDTMIVDGTQSSSAVKASEITDLEIAWVSGTITITPNAGSDQIIIVDSPVSDEKYAMQLTQSGRKLKIEFSEEDLIHSFGIHSNNAISKDLSIAVPADWVCEELTIEAASANVTVSDLTIGNVEFDGASGLCNFTNCQIGTLSVDTASGDVTFSGTLEELDFDAMSACFYATLTNVPSRMDMDTMSGDLDVTLPEDCGFTLNLDAMSSDFSSDFPTTMENGSHVCGDGACRINVSAMSGDVAIHKHGTSSHHEDTHH